MKINNKGLTLVELIAVLVVLILIFLLAITKVNDLLDNAENDSVKADAITYVKAVNGEFVLVNGPSLFPVYEGIFTYSELNDIGIKVSGTKPTDGYIYNINNKTVYGCLEYKNNKAIIENDVVTSVSEGKCELPVGNVENLNSYIAVYTGSEQTFTVPVTGKYSLEVWGAQGGGSNYNSFHEDGGYGAYSKGIVNLNEGDVLYINVGGKGTDVDYHTPASPTFDSSFGYNGGGYSNYITNNSSHGGGGGATHIALSSGLLSTLSSKLDDILIVAGGGGGSSTHSSYPKYSGTGGSAGGYIGNSGIPSSTTCYNYGTGGTQTSVGTYIACSSDGRTTRNDNPPAAPSFGLGSSHTSNRSASAYGSGGAGLYGGQSGYHGPGGGGSSYIGNRALTNKVMYCYNCQESEGENTKTISTTNVSKVASANFAKIGDGYARILYLGE